jgi:hypothetical protein
MHHFFCRKRENDQNRSLLEVIIVQAGPLLLPLRFQQ